MNSVKIAVIGTGLIGQRHLEIASKIPECELVAASDAHPDGAQMAQKYGIPFYRDYQTLLAEQDVEGVIIATPTNTHAPIGIACAEKGVHILVEKPITGSLADAQKLVDAADKHGVQILVGHHRRHNLLVQQAHEIVQSGQIGNLIGVTALFTLLKPTDYFAVEWRNQPGGGPILTNLIHDIDNLRYICGEIENVYAAASSATRGFEVEDTASLTLHFANGALGSILVSDATPSPWSYELTSGENDDYPFTGQDCYRFCGTEGSLAFPSMTLWRYPKMEKELPGWYQPLEQLRRIETVENRPLYAQLSHFCKVVRGEEEPLISGREGLKTLAATQAVLESAQQKLPIMPHALV